jgi:AraC-like DNA-binding protein
VRFAPRLAKRRTNTCARAESRVPGDLLVTTPMPVTEICDAVGFQSLGSFSSLFRKLAGETPGAYRAARRKSAPIPTCFVRMFRADR